MNCPYRFGYKIPDSCKICYDYNALTNSCKRMEKGLKDEVS